MRRWFVLLDGGDVAIDRRFELREVDLFHIVEVGVGVVFLLKGGLECYQGGGFGCVGRLVLQREVEIYLRGWLLEMSRREGLCRGGL